MDDVGLDYRMKNRLGFSEDLEVSYHVVPIEGAFSLIKTREIEPLRQFDSKVDAVEYSKILAKDNNSTLYIHDDSGRISERFVS